MKDEREPKAYYYYYYYSSGSGVFSKLDNMYNRALAIWGRLFL
jgi:hypothetical protein